MTENNNNHEKKYPEELFESAYGKEELEHQKELHRKRTLKPDFKVSFPNLIECVNCGSEDVPNKILEVPVGVLGIISAKIKGAQCEHCSERYYNSKDLQALRDLEELVRRRELTDRIKPLHLQSVEYRVSSAKAARDDDEDGDEDLEELSNLEDYEVKRERIYSNFEKALPRILDKAKENEARLKLEYQEKLQKSLLDNLKNALSKPSFQTWMSNLSILSIDSNSLILCTDTEFKRDWLETRYTQFIMRAFEEITGTEYKVEFVVAPRKETDA